jgi:hypothetical protein
MLDWEHYIRVAERFQHKARTQDREDLKHTIILRLAQVASSTYFSVSLNRWHCFRGAGQFLPKANVIHTIDS